MTQWKFPYDQGESRTTGKTAKGGKKNLFFPSELRDVGASVGEVKNEGGTMNLP